MLYVSNCIIHDVHDTFFFIYIRDFDATCVKSSVIKAFFHENYNQRRQGKNIHKYLLILNKQIDTFRIKKSLISNLTKMHQNQNVSNYR